MSVPQSPEGLIRVEPLRVYTPEAAADLGLLMHELDANFSSDPVPQATLEAIIESPTREQIVATYSGEPAPRVVGALTLTEVVEPGIKYGFLGGVVVDPSMRGFGIGRMMMAVVDEWCEDRGLASLELVTETYRPAAIALYKKWGAEKVGEAMVYSKGYEPR